MDFLIDTTLLIDLWREQRKPGPATKFATTHALKTAGMTWIVKGEFLRGAYAVGLSAPQVEDFLNSYLLVLPTLDTIDRYARLFVELKSSSISIGPNDLWIAAACLERDIPLVTRNSNDFKHVPGLNILTYAFA